ncbi:mechanosensitive ion channel family protein [Hymenobacter siberiensis]|jgi:small conductance mechanosensitive channel|uniref:mechanosensitive ion channel family protein n=1 Tax=Hymenobacter siberiensis TaxID=2848396 RepID=UPI001C1DCE98|nr:mechanosensitive ion channel family protein [Hymenobacter siberiensis]MBU6120430.1 mechanosensitive ion channel family protein [Hymenobacter siberiensis]
MLAEFTTVFHTYWTQFLFVLPRLVMAAVLLAVTWLASSRLRSFLTARLAAHSADPLLTNFLTQVGRWLLVLSGLLLALQIIGFSGVVGGLLGGLGLSAFLVGFAFKDIAENFLAGVILAFNRPFNVNDSIQVKDHMGRVMELNLRTTRIKTYDGKDIYVPNSVLLKESVTNFTRDGFIRQNFLVGIDYDADVPTVIEAISGQLRQEDEVLQTIPHEPFIIVHELATSTVNLKVFFWTESEEYRRGVLELRSRVMNRVKTVLMAADNVSLPADIVEMQFPKNLPELRVRIIDQAPAGPPAA